MKALSFDGKRINCYETGIEFLNEEYGETYTLYAASSSFDSGKCKYYYDSDGTDHVDYLGEFESPEDAEKEFIKIIKEIIE